MSSDALLPDFLVIGAMKAGTTSLYLDLSQHPAIFFPSLKEPGNLGRDQVRTATGRADYASLYRHAKAGQRRGDASTDYSKLPDIGGVAARARDLLDPATRIVYLVREPVSRAISHHHHLVSRGLAPVGFAAAVAEVPGLVEYSCYGQQIEPWLDAYGREAIKVVRLEDYGADRQGSVESVLHHLGLAPIGLKDTDEIGNKSDLDPPARGGFAKVRDNRLYRRLARPLLPEAMRRRVRRALLPSPPPRPDRPTLATVQRLLERFEADEWRLRSMLGAPAPLWDFDQVEAAAAARERDRR